MAQFRNIDPKIWQHKFLRRCPWYTRDVFLYLFSAAADDEGRFEADAYAILDAAFGRSHPVDEAQVTEALSELRDVGLLVLYRGADGCGLFGFLCGWYEHQHIQPGRRVTSKLPVPPVPVSSWSKADEIRAAYAKAQGREIRHCNFHLALLWGRGEQVDEEMPVEGQHSVNEVLTDCYPKGKGEGKGKGKGEGSTESTSKDSTPTELESMGKSLTPQQLALNAAWSACGLDGMPTNPGRKKPISRFMGIIKRKGLEQVGAWAGLREGKPLVVPAGADPIEHFWDVFLNDMEQPWRWGWDEEGQCLKQAGGVGGTGRQPQLSDSQEEAGRVWADIPEDALGDQS